MATQPLIHKKDVILVKPAESTPSEVLSLSTIDNDRNLELLCQTLYVYRANSTTNNDNSDPTLGIKQALSRVLVYYYPLAGKLKREKDGKLRITCTADGAPLLEAEADCALSSLHYFDGIDVETAKLFVFDWPSNSSFGYHPLVLQLTKFSCGGFTLGMGLSHSVCDGSGAAQFFKAMAELASGKSEPSLKPVWEREKLVGTAGEDPLLPTIDKNSVAASPYLPTTDVVHECFYIDGESLKRLKTNVSKERQNTQNGDIPPHENFTTIEALGAYIWRSRSRALQLNPDGKTMFCMAMGIRKFLHPPLNEGYYGNAFLSSSHLILTVRELDEMPLSKVAKLIKESKKVISCPDYVPKTLNILETIVQQNTKIEISTGTSMVLTDWRQLGLLEGVDFGRWELVNMVPLPWNNIFVDMCIFLSPSKISSSTKDKDGVRLLVTIPRAAMAKLKDEIQRLQVVGADDI